MSASTSAVNGGLRPSSYTLTFAMKIGLVRESVRVDLQSTGGRLTTEMLRDIAFAFLDRNFPEHGFYQLQNRVLLFCHNPHDPNILRLINGVTATADDIKDNTLVEIVLSADTAPEELEIRPHILHVHSYKSPHFCDYCGEMLFGLVRQGLKCEGCGLNYHKRCAYKIPKNCSQTRCSQFYRQLSSTDSINSYGTNATVTPSTPTTPDVLSTASRLSQISTLTTAGTPETVDSMPGNGAGSNMRSKSWCGYSGQLTWSDRNYGTSLCVPHTFVVHNYKRPTVCQHCKKLLRGLFRQGMQCKDCKFNCHKKCASRVPKDCQGETKWKYNRQSSYTTSVNGSDFNADRLSVASSSDIGEPTQMPQSYWDEKDGCITDDDEPEPEPPAKPMLSPAQSNNIPLMRVVQSRKHTKRAMGACIREGWMVHYTNRDNVRRRHFWKLDTRCITLYQNDATSHYFKEIALGDIVRIETHHCGTGSSASAVAAAVSDPAFEAPQDDYVFEMHCSSNTIFYVGEDPEVGDPLAGCGGRSVVRSVQSGSGLELALSWEVAIRQARLPLTPSPSASDTTLAVAVSDPIIHKSNGSRNDCDGTTEEDAELDISQLYQIFPDDVLGSGQFGVVYGARCKLTNRDVAIKVIDKQRFPTKQEAQLKNEVSILHEINHPGIVTLDRRFETDERIFVVMEKLKGDMLEMILSSTRGRLTERLSRFIISQILIALKHLHSRHIVHCDLKPENVLLASESPFPQVKLCDFGFARIIGDQSFRRSVVGTPAYLAPEVLKSKGYNRSLDMWSVGVIIYVSLSGTFPFNEDEEITDQIQNAAFMFPQNPWNEISQSAIDLINHLLQIKMRRRLTADKSLAHNWLQDYRCWCDLRKLESQVGQRFLTHESDDHRWQEYRTEHKLPDWPIYGHSDITSIDRFNFNKMRQMPPSPS